MSRQKYFRKILRLGLGPLIFGLSALGGSGQDVPYQTASSRRSCPGPDSLAAPGP
jgi:hypothetical protein